MAVADKVNRLEDWGECPQANVMIVSNNISPFLLYFTSGAFIELYFVILERYRINNRISVGREELFHPVDTAVSCERRRT
jgi:hypothetical protein